MAKHKRKRPKNKRAGCLLCKPWKMNGYSPSRAGAEGFGSHKRRRFATDDVRDYLREPQVALNDRGHR